MKEIATVLYGSTKANLIMEEPDEKNTCRICLQKHEVVYPLLGREKELRSLSAGLRRVGVKIRIPGPKSICNECLKELESALIFLDKCELSNQKLTEQLVKTTPRANNVVINNSLLNFTKKVSDVVDDEIEDRAKEHQGAVQNSNMGPDKENALKPVTTHTCSICQKVFNRKFNFKLHLQRHSGDFDWACPTCGARAASGWLARRHCGPRPRRACPVPGCGKTYTTQHNLNTHIRAHKGERPFECSECGKRFTSKNTLTDHIRIHTGVKPYMCPVCGRRFTTNKLSAHVCTHARRPPAPPAPAAARPPRAPRPARPLACPLCPNTYNHKQSLNKHMRKQHSQSPGYLKLGLVNTDTKTMPENIETPADK